MSQNSDVDTTAKPLTIHFVVSGRVQGVFFRASTRRMADHYGVGGWVRNLPDGRVEGVASGCAQALDAFRQWLYHGPVTAQVVNLEVTQSEFEEFSGFEIR